MNYQRLILFDIDGTLLKTDKSARESLSRAVKEFSGKNVELAVSDCAGKTDFLIIDSALKKCRVKYNNDDINLVLNTYLNYLSLYYENDKSYLYEGIIELLNKLNEDKTNLLGLLTGNVKRGAEIKLKRFGILRLFKTGAYGDDGFYREELPEVALKRAYDFSGKNFDKDKIFVIGDTESDIKCGNLINAKTIAICRQKDRLEKIRNENPNFIFFDSKNYKEILKAIYV